MATAKTRFNALGLSGSKDSTFNIGDHYIRFIEFPLPRVASTASQDTGIPLPTNTFLSLSAYVVTTTAEVTGTVKTIDIGTDSLETAIITDADVSSVDPDQGTSFSQHVQAGAAETYHYRLGSADFAEFEGYAVIVVVGSDL
jgi:hypothetical protein